MFICTYSIKSKIIISIYYSKNVSKENKKFKSYSFYIITIIIQIILLLIWTVTQNGVDSKEKLIEKVGYYKYDVCSKGNEIIMNVIFFIDYSLLFLSIIMVYRGKNCNYIYIYI